MATLTLSPAFAPDARPTARPAARPVTRPAARPATLHLTRRGRLVVTFVMIALLLVVGLGTAGKVAAGTPGQAPALESVVVQPGQSLWRFAAESMPGTDTREAVLRIRELNGLTGSVIHPGQVLVVPAS